MYMKVVRKWAKVIKKRGYREMTPNTKRARMFWRRVRLSVPCLRYNLSVKLELSKEDMKLMRLNFVSRPSSTGLPALRFLFYEIRLHCIVGGLKWLRVLSTIQL